MVQDQTVNAEDPYREICTLAAEYIDAAALRRWVGGIGCFEESRLYLVRFYLGRCSQYRIAVEGYRVRRNSQEQWGPEHRFLIKVLHY